MKGRHLFSETRNLRIGLTSCCFSWEAPVWCLLRTHKGKSRWEEEQSWYTQYTCWVRHLFFKLKYWFCWKYQYNKFMFYFNDHLHFYSCEWLCR